jgi:hypothetical protein
MSRSILHKLDLGNYYAWHSVGLPLPSKSNANFIACNDIGNMIFVTGNLENIGIDTSFVRLR